MLVFAALAVIAAVWAIRRHYTVPMAPMLVPKPDSGAPAPNPTEIEIER
jgi:hypothetical protein